MAATTDRRQDAAPAEGPGPRTTSSPSCTRPATASSPAPSPSCRSWCSRVVAWQLWDNLLDWSDLIVFAIMYVAHRPRHHGRLPPAVHAPRVQDRARPCAASSPRSARWRSRARSSPGSPTTASTTPSPTSRATRTARTSTTAHGLKRRAARARARARRLAVHPHRSAAPKTRYAPDLIADPVVRFVDRTFVAVGARRPRSCRSCSAG